MIQTRLINPRRVSLAGVCLCALLVLSLGCASQLPGASQGATTADRSQWQAEDYFDHLASPDVTIDGLRYAWTHNDPSLFLYCLSRETQQTILQYVDRGALRMGWQRVKEEVPIDLGDFTVEMQEALLPSPTGTPARWVQARFPDPEVPGNIRIERFLFVQQQLGAPDNESRPNWHLHYPYAPFNAPGNYTSREPDGRQGGTIVIVQPRPPVHPRPTFLDDPSPWR